MKAPLPPFPYHPSPLATGAIVASTEACAVCAKVRGFVYAGPIYREGDEDERVCPWCIANGSAAERLDATFVDAHPLLEQGLAAAIVDEVTQRTPGYVSWQEAYWLAHCDDACEFHGDASASDLHSASSEERARFLSETGLDEEGWENLVSEYEPGGDIAFYKFVCRHCRVVRLGWDSV